MTYLLALICNALPPRCCRWFPRAVLLEAMLQLQERLILELE
jgi:hypothetical protein